MKPDTAELREQEVARRMRLEFARIYSAIKAGDKPTMKTMIDAMGNLVADDQVMGDLILAALSSDRLLAGAHISGLVSALIESEAGEVAEAQVAQLERNAKQDPDQIPMRRRFDMREPP